MRHGSLFSGIGGFDLAAEWMGWENIFHCEWMEFPRKVLDYHFPDADSHIDICTTDFKKYANKIDILTGGFPCQPFSLAGKRKGTDDERYLWGEMLRAIQEIKPRFVIAENVFGITNIDGGLVFQQVCIDLEGQGYEVQPFIIPACAKNAPHRRDRCWFIAYANGNDGRSTNRESGCQESKANGEGEQSVHSRTWTTSNEGNATNTNCYGLGKQWRYDSSRQINARCNPPFKWSANSKNFDNGDTSANFSGQSTIDGRIGEQANVETNKLATAERICGVDKECDQCKGIISNDRCENVNCRALVQNGHERIQSSKHRGMDKDCGDISSNGTNECENDGTIINRMDRDATNSERSGGIQRSENIQSKKSNGFQFIRNGRKRNATDTNSNGLNERNGNDEVNTSQGGEYAFNDIEQIPTDTKCIGRTQIRNDNGQFETPQQSECGEQQFSGADSTQSWWRNFPSQPPVCSGDDGIPRELDGITFPKWRAESIKGYGNAIVPQIAYQLFQIINEL
jgi:DNA (cytosine-5)-methyltransferase 1